MALLAAVLAAPLVSTPAARAADPPCDQLNASAIYVAADDSALPLVREAAWKLAREDDTKVVVYQTLPGCAAVRAASPTQVCGADNCLRGTARFIPVGDLADWGPKDRVRALALTPKTCALPSTGAAAHIALSEVAAASCPASANLTPPGLIDVAGPVSPLVFVTVRVNSQDPDQAIHAAEAYFAFGKGKDAGIRPWLNEDYLVRRDPNSALAVLLGLRLNLQPARLRGVLPTTPKCTTPICATESDSVFEQLKKAGAAGLAFLPSAEADQRRLDLRPLAFQALGQRGAFFPDSRASAVDKRNVREGRYPLWGQLHLVAQADAMNPRQPLPLLQRISEIILGTGKPVDAEEPLLTPVRTGYIPQCAMAVSRLEDRSPLRPYTAADPCARWFECSVPNATNAQQCAMQVCQDDSKCGGGKCRRGYCEAR